MWLLFIEPALRGLGLVALIVRDVPAVLGPVLVDRALVVVRQHQAPAGNEGLAVLVPEDAVVGEPGVVGVRGDIDGDRSATGSAHFAGSHGLDLLR